MWNTEREKCAYGTCKDNGTYISHFQNNRYSGAGIIDPCYSSELGESFGASEYNNKVRSEIATSRGKVTKVDESRGPLTKVKSCSRQVELLERLETARKITSSCGPNKHLRRMTHAWSMR